VTPNRDESTLVSRLLRGLGRVEAGLKLQQERILAYNDSVPIEYAGTDHELRVHTDPELDLDYYTFELGRLIALTEEIDKLFNRPTEIDQARTAFLAAAPQAKNIRNALVHFDARPRLDDVVFLGGAIRRFHPNGRVEHLVDARYEQHEAALCLVDAVGKWLRGRLHDAIAADPALPIDEQIRRKSLRHAERYP